jgi:hypothetical protein
VPLYDAGTCPHTVTILQATSGVDAGGGTTLSFATRTSGVKGILNATSASQRELFAQMGIVVSHTFSTTDVTAQRGDKLTYGTRSFHINGIRQTEAIGSIPVLNQLTLEEQI